MTWKDFKDLLEARGVADEDVIWYIDTNALVPDEITVEFMPGKDVPLHGGREFCVY